MDNVDWKDVNADQLVEISQIGNIQLKGKITVTDVTLEQLNALIGVFGESAFDKNAELFINAPDAIFVTGRTELLEGESEDYACIVFGAEVQNITWTISSGSSYATIDAATGLLTTIEGTTGTRTLMIRVIARTSVGTKSIDTSVSVKARTYPASDTTTLSGSNRLDNTREIYKLDITTPNINGEYVVAWSLTGMDGYAEIESSSNTQCVVKKLQEATTVVNGILTAAVRKKVNNYSLFSKTFAIEIVNDTVAETDKGVVTALYNKGLCANSAYITKEEAALITDVDLQPGTSFSTSVFYSQRNNIKSFDGFQYFTGVSNVGAYLFYQCVNLTSIKLPETILNFGPYCFRSCSKLRSLNIPVGAAILPAYAFYENVGLEEINIPEGINTIGEYCFYKCSKLRSIVLPNTIQRIENQAFQSCTQLSSINFPPSLTSIGYTCFNVTGLTSIEIPDGCTLGTTCFAACKSLTYAKLPSDMTSMPYSLFQNCSALTSIELPQALKSLDRDCFNGCSSLASIELPPKVVSLGNNCFRGCTSLASIHLPASLNTLGSGVFAGCGSLQLIVDGGNPYFSTLGGALYNKDFTKIVCYTLDKVESSFVIPSSVNTISDDCFSGCASLRTITIPSSVTKIGKQCFYECSSLTEVHIPDSVTNIDTTNMFVRCTSLVNVTLPNSTSSIGSSCFYMCTSLTFIEIPPNVKSMLGGAFSGCRALKTMVFHSLVAPTSVQAPFGQSVENYTGRDTYNTGENKLVVPFGAIGYDNTTSPLVFPTLLDKNKCGFTLRYLYEPTECTSLTIVADDALNGKMTRTTLNYTAITNGFNALLGEITGVEVTGSALSSEFPQNTSYTDTVEREVSFTYLGVTATTTITQGVWVDTNYSVDLNNQWQESATIANPDSATYDGVYESFSNKGKDNTAAIMYIDIVGYETFKFYVRSYAEGSYDYVVVSNLDATLTNSTTSGTAVKFTTSGMQTSGTAISNYQLVEFTGIDGGEHRISVMYRKDGSGNNGDDRGYVLIPKNQ